MGHWYLPLSLCLIVLSKNIDSPPQYDKIIERRHCKIGENVTLSYSSAINRIDKRERCDSAEEWKTLEYKYNSSEYNFMCETACYNLFFGEGSENRKYNFTAIAENVTQVEPTVDCNGQWGLVIVGMVIGSGIAAMIFVICLVWKNKQLAREVTMPNNALTEDVALKEDDEDVEESDYAEVQDYGMQT